MRETFWLRHDLHVVAIALVILALGWAVREEAGAVTRTITREGLAIAVPAGWIVEPKAGDLTVVRGEDAVTRVELRVAEAPGPLVTLESLLELDRAQRYGQLYLRLESGRATAGGREWLRTVYAYAFKPTAAHAPRLATAVEYALDAAHPGGGPLLVVTLHAPQERVAELEREILAKVTVR
jgi:hypothetical protein